ncbi:MAG: type I methionyl aminopeptidase, partial [candidate division WOR-3 bacterium]
MIILKSREEIENIKEASKIVAKVLYDIEEYIKPGVSTKKLNDIIDRMIRKMGGSPAFLGYKGYPASSCISINEEVVHGIPSENKILEEGSIVKIDVGVNKNGFFGDGAKTYKVGKVNGDLERLLQVTEKALYIGIDKARAGNRVGDIGFEIQQFVECEGFSVVRELAGHGVGHYLHEEPVVPNYGKRGEGPLLKKGLVIAIEPMVNMGSHEVKVLRDKWTIVTLDGKPSAHFEHTVLIDDEPIILTT